MPIPLLDCYSIALLPAHAVERQCRQIIDRLAAQYAAPPFIPHISIVTRLQGDEAVLIEKTETIARATASSDIDITGVEYRDQWNQCLFLRCADTDALMDLHQRAAAAVGVNASPSFMPHLSLLYGDYPAGQKPSMAENVGSYPHHFIADRLALFRNKGLPNAWTIITEFALQ